METKYSVPEMSCEHCVGRITKALEAVGAKAVADLETKIVTVSHPESLTDEAIKTAIDDAGYASSTVK